MVILKCDCELLSTRALSGLHIINVILILLKRCVSDTVHSDSICIIEILAIIDWLIIILSMIGFLIYNSTRSKFLFWVRQQRINYGYYCPSRLPRIIYNQLYSEVDAFFYSFCLVRRKLKMITLTNIWVCAFIPNLLTIADWRLGSRRNPLHLALRLSSLREPG